ncbi:hypothetical protein [Eudoraea sp.]|uniref:hypothetical protein n=1 Tax=Eudoraea sp. TaxID=1979955 RepID=UPI003C780EA9
MVKIHYALLLSLGLSSGLFAQNNTSIEDSYESYFELPRESIFLHLNKSTYVVGEELWFSAYTYDRKNGLPFTQTTNLHVVLYNEQGKPLEDQLFMAVNGFARGNISIDSTYASGDYFIKASTNWMKNFSEDDSFIQKIQVINGSVEVRDLADTTYDLQLLPEGGHMVEEVESVIGVKLIDGDGRGVVFEKGSLVNDSGISVMDFDGNSLGMASFPFRPQKDTYNVSIRFGDNKVVTAPLPHASEKGIVLRVVNNYSAEDIFFAVATNKKTLEDLEKKKYQLLVHKDGDIRATRSVVFDNSQQETILSINKDQLFPGVNTVTLFDERDRPIAERLFFNNYGIRDIQAEVRLAKKVKDSLTIDLKILSEGENNGHLSISVLPSETRSYNQKVNIFSEFLLKPYVRGYVENPAYYFRGFGPRKSYDLDLLLLVQGWSRYEWKNIFNRAPVINFPYENGLTLKGSIMGADLRKFPSFYMEDSKYHDSRTVELESPDFEIPNLLVEKNEEVQIKLIRENGKPSSRRLYAKIVPDSNPSLLGPSELTTPNNYASELPELDYKLENKTIFLDEVEVVEQKQKFSNIIGKDEIVVDQQVVNMYPRVTDFLRVKGYNIKASLGAVKISSRRSLGGAPPVIYLDGTRLVAETSASSSSPPSQAQGNGFGGSVKTPDAPVDDPFQESGSFSFLYELYTAEIERIEVNPRPDVTEGVNGAGGVIKIWTRRTPLVPTDATAMNKSFIDTTHGFDVPKKFYTPKYIYSNSLFEYTGTIHWEPQLELDANGKGTFNIADTGMENISFFIEGMTEDGSLISTIKTIKMSEKSNP